MKTILLLIPQGETQDLVASQLSADYQVVCCDQCPPEGEAAKLQDIAAVLVDLEHARNQGLTLAERLKDRSPFSAVSFLGLTFGLPREQDLDCIQHGFLTSSPFPAPGNCC